MKIRSAVPENGCLIFLTDGKKTKKQQKTTVKHIRYRLIGGCVNNNTRTMLYGAVIMTYSHCESSPD